MLSAVMEKRQHARTGGYCKQRDENCKKVSKRNAQSKLL